MKFKRFNEINQDDFKTDLHIHSNTIDGKDSIQEIIEYAQNLKLKKIAITDHARNTSDYCLNHVQKIAELSKGHSVEVLKGFEVKVNNFHGEIDTNDEIIKESDIIIASVHRFPIGGKLFSAKEFSSETSQAIEFELSYNALERGGFDVLGHAGGMSVVAHGEFSLDYFEKLIQKCCEVNIAFELNYRYHLQFFDKLKPILEKYNPLVTFSSDAHKKEDIAGWMNYE